MNKGGEGGSRDLKGREFSHKSLEDKREALRSKLEAATGSCELELELELERRRKLQTKDSVRST